MSTAYQDYESVQIASIKLLLLDDQQLSIQLLWKLSYCKNNSRVQNMQNLLDLDDT